MRKTILAVDPGAERLGYAALWLEESAVGSAGSGIIGLKRGSEEEYQTYRLRLISKFEQEATLLINAFQPELVVNETIPPVGGNAANQIQRQLALTALTAFQTVAVQHGLELKQVAASTVKAKIGGNRKAGKVAVRNGVFKVMPSTQIFKKQWVGVFDESDAFAVGLTHLGFNVKDGQVTDKAAPAAQDSA